MCHECVWTLTVSGSLSANLNPQNTYTLKPQSQGCEILESEVDDLKSGVPVREKERKREREREIYIYIDIYIYIYTYFLFV